MMLGFTMIMCRKLFITVALIDVVRFSLFNDTYQPFQKILRYN